MVTYLGWLRVLNSIFYERFGTTVGYNPEIDWKEMFEQGLTPQEALEMVDHLIDPYGD